VAIVGRPNVGKSTLFNRLTKSRRSIVGDEPGITRDRIYGEYEWIGRQFRLVDTGGIVPDDPELIPTEIYAQAKVALEEADALVLVVDARTELASPDYDLVRLLLRGGKPLFLAVNKVEGEAMAYGRGELPPVGHSQRLSHQLRARPGHRRPAGRHLRSHSRAPVLSRRTKRPWPPKRQRPTLRRSL
jgi:small GTP-binding protein